MKKIVIGILLGFIVNTLQANKKDTNPVLNPLRTEQVSITTDRDIYIAGETVFFNISILSNDTASNSLSNICYLVLRDKIHTYNKLFLKLDKGKFYGSFYLPDTLATNFYEIVGFTNYMRNFDESSFFRKKLIVANRFDELLNNLYSSDHADKNQINEPLNNQDTITGQSFRIALEKDSFATREKIRLEIIWNKNGQDFPFSECSVSVRQLYPFNDSIIRSFCQDSYAPQINSTGTNTYPIENQGIYLNGFLSTKDSIRIPNECIYLSTEDTIANFVYSFTDHHGKFQFYLSDYYLNKSLFVSPKEDLQQKFKIQLEDKFLLNIPFESTFFEPNREFRKYIFESQKFVTIQKSYQIENNKTTYNTLNIKYIPLAYTNPTSIILTSDFIHLNDFKDISENILPGFRIKYVNQVYKPYIINYLSRNYFEEPAGIFINGIPNYNLNPVMNLNSEEITKIELCKAPRIKGLIRFSGIISIITAANIKLIPPPPGSVVFNLGKSVDNSLYDPPRYSSQTKTSSKPDFRQLLYWNPCIKLNSPVNTLEFYASDLVADYIIEIQGLDKSGKKVSTYTKFKVFR
jgi:hypothetical protein